VLVPLLLLVVAGALRFYRLDYPERMYFDEIYYAVQGLEYFERGVEKGFSVHPPLGKWLIAASISQLGDSSLGWRFSSAVTGTLTVLVTYLIGLRLFRRRGVAAMAAFFVAIDGLALTMSRISMLDAPLALLVGVGVWCLLKDRDAQWAAIPDRPDPLRPLPSRPHRWRWVAGVVFGLALATKASALLAIAGAGLFVLASEMLWRRRITGSPWTQWWRIAVSGGLALLAVPALVYVLSYTGWFANFSETRLGQEQCPEGVCAVSTVDIARIWFGEQAEIVRFHRDLEATHQYRSHPGTWLTLYRPVAYYYENCTDEKLADDECVTEQGNVEEILGIGNPVVWWLALFAYPLALWAVIRWGDWRAAVPLGFVFVQYLPWFLAPRANFLFYMTPAVPFIALTLAWALRKVGDRFYLAWVPGLVAALAVVAFVFWYPIWSGSEISLEAWNLRMWLQSWI
jgi:dolichyl-phosphate-mannose--protein O-mannosyl transferase